MKNSGHKLQCIIEFVYTYKINTSLARTGISSKQPSHLYAAHNVWYAIFKCYICIAGKIKDKTEKISIVYFLNP